MKNEIIIDGITYIRKDVPQEKTSQKKFKNIFETTCIEDVFEYGGEDLSAFTQKLAHLPVHKLNQELIEKAGEILNEGWEATKENTWYTPYFKRTKKGLVYFGVDCWNFGYLWNRCISFSLALKDENIAKHAGNILLPQYNLMILPS